VAQRMTSVDIYDITWRFFVFVPKLQLRHLHWLILSVRWRPDFKIAVGLTLPYLKETLLQSSKHIYIYISLYDVDRNNVEYFNGHRYQQPPMVKGMRRVCVP
jgi:hypothetical protein